MWIQEIGDYLRFASPLCSLTEIFQHGGTFTRMCLLRFHVYRWDDHFRRSTTMFNGRRTPNILRLGEPAAREFPSLTPRFDKQTQWVCYPIITYASGLTSTFEGWMHNRARMIAAMYLTKDLMIDWRLGERVSDLSHLIRRAVRAKCRRSTSCSNS
jgi:hypothetical protein